MGKTNNFRLLNWPVGTNISFKFSLTPEPNRNRLICNKISQKRFTETPNCNNSTLNYVCGMRILTAFLKTKKIIGAIVGQTEKSLSLRPIFKHLITINYVCKNSLDTTG